MINSHGVAIDGIRFFCLSIKGFRLESIVAEKINNLGRLVDISQAEIQRSFVFEISNFKAKVLLLKFFEL